MEFEQSVNDFYYIFYIFGLTTFCPRTFHLPKIAHALPPLVHVLLLIVTSIMAVYAQYHLSIFNEIIDALMTYVLISSECILNFAAIAQAIIYRKQFIKLYGQYVSIQKCITVRMERRLCFKPFRSKFISVTVVVLLIFTVTLISRFRLFTKHTNPLMDASLMLMQLTSTVVHLHSIMHVHLLNFLYQFLNQCLGNQVPLMMELRSQQPFGDKNIPQLRQIKIMHYKLWEIAMNINRIFGWSNLLLILKNNIQIAYSLLTVYWVHLYNLDDDSVLAYSRETQ